MDKDGEGVAGEEECKVEVRVDGSELNEEAAVPRAMAELVGPVAQV